MENEIQKVQHNTAINFFDPTQFETLQRMCKMYANSELVPDMYKVGGKNTTEKAMANCMIAVEVSQRIGASPLMVMQNMVIIYGRPSWSSKFLIATVNTCGRFNPLQYRFKNLGELGKVEFTTYEKKWIQGADGKSHCKNEAHKEIFDGTGIENIQCVAYTTAKGSNEVLESSPVDIKLAIQEGWYTKAGSKWRTMTKQMLTYRAASFWTSAYAPELSMGMKTDDEVRDIVDIPYEDVVEEVEKEKKEATNGPILGFVGQEKDQPKKVDKEPVKQDSKEAKPEPEQRTKKAPF